MNNDLNQIQIFSQVAQRQSFTKAAEFLEIEKSTVSNKVTQLETRLGVKLLHRTTRRVELTEAGAQYLKFCQQALMELQKGEDLLSDLQQQAVGHLRVAVPQNFADLILPNLLPRFLDAHPRLSMEVLQGRQNVDLIKEGFDLAIQANFTEVADSSLIYRQIYQSKRIFVASNQHIEQHGFANSIEQLCNQPYIGSVAGEGIDETFNQVFYQGKWFTLKPRLSVNSMQAITGATVSGLGFSIMPIGMARAKIDSGELRQIAPDVALTDSKIYLVYPSRKGQPAKLRAFIDLMLKWGQDMNSAN